MKIVYWIIAFIVISFVISTTFAQMPEQLVISTSKRLEKNPFDKKTIKMRKESIEWINQNLKPSFSCTGEFVPRSYKFRSELLATFIIASVAFIIENPEKSKNEDAVKNAGLESMVKSYEQIIKVKTKSKNQVLEELLKAHRNGISLSSFYVCTPL